MNNNLIQNNAIINILIIDSYDKDSHGSYLTGLIKDINPKTKIIEVDKTNVYTNTITNYTDLRNYLSNNKNFPISSKIDLIVSLVKNAPYDDE